MAESSHLAQLDYTSRINRVVDFITANLDSRLTLAQLAEVACFSPYHFHRIFTSTTGEPVNAFVTRVRLERALYLLSHTRSTIQSVAESCGFTTSSDFSRTFGKHYGTAPRRFDLSSYRRLKRRALDATIEGADRDRGGVTDQHEEHSNSFSVRFVDYPARRVVYRRVWHPFEGNPVVPVANELVAWARDHGLAGGQWLGYMWEDPEITRLEDCRYDVAVCVPIGFSPPHGIDTLDFPAMRVAEVDATGSIDVEQGALDWIYRSWLPSSGYEPDHQPCFERWHGLPFEDGTEHFSLSIQLAVRKAG